MKLLLERADRNEAWTLGRLYVDGEYFCDTLEDKDRGLTSDMTEDEIKKAKVKSQTAIPTGTYSVTLNVVSPKFSKKDMYRKIDGKLPRILNVKGFDGILIHVGNTRDDTDGCVLVGENGKDGTIHNSKTTFFRLYARLLEDKDNITLHIN